jgi:hypothetical protein
VRNQPGKLTAILPHTRLEQYRFVGVALTAGSCEEFLFGGYFIWAFAPLTAPGSRGRIGQASIEAQPHRCWGLPVEWPVGRTATGPEPAYFRARIPEIVPGRKAAN